MAKTELVCGFKIVFLEDLSVLIVLTLLTSTDEDTLMTLYDSGIFNPIQVGDFNRL